MKRLPIVAAVSLWATAANATVVYGVYTYHENERWTSVTTNCDYCFGLSTYTDLSGIQVIIANDTSGSGGFSWDPRGGAGWSLTVDQLGQPVSWNIYLYESFGVAGSMSAEETNLSDTVGLYYDSSYTPDYLFNGWVSFTYTAPPGSWTVTDLLVTPDPVVTPLPATLPLLGLGFATLAFARRRYSR